MLGWNKVGVKVRVSLLLAPALARLVQLLVARPAAPAPAAAASASAASAGTAGTASTAARAIMLRAAAARQTVTVEPRARGDGGRRASSRARPCPLTSTRCRMSSMITGVTHAQACGTALESLKVGGPALTTGAEGG